MVDHGLKGMDIAVQFAVFGHEWHFGANALKGLFDTLARLAFGVLEVERLGGHEQFNGEDRADKIHDLARLEGGGHAHRDVVFASGGGGDRIDTGRMAEDAAFDDERGGRDLGNHEAGVEAAVGREKGGQA